MVNTMTLTPRKIVGIIGVVVIIVLLSCADECFVAKDDLPLLDMKTAYVPSEEPLECVNKKRCVFGLYKIAGQASGGPVTFTLSTHLAGAVYKVTYAGYEFVNPVAIVGASMQTSVFYDEQGAYNPTEAGLGAIDSFTGRSTSRMLELRGTSKAVYTSVQAAYFNKPDAQLKWGLNPKHTTLLSDTIINKRIEFVDKGTCDYTMNMVVQPDKHSNGLWEVLCVWCPRAACAQMQVRLDGTWKDAEDKFNLFWVLRDRASGLVMANTAGTVAMGIKLMQFPKGSYWDSPRYGTPLSNKLWRKWSITQAYNRRKDKAVKIPGGVYEWKMRMFFGTLAEVKTRIATIK